MRDVRRFGVAVLALVLGACGGGGGGGSGGPAPAPAEEALAQYGDCDELRAALIEDARQKIAVEADELRSGGFFGGEAVPTASPAGGAGPTPAPSPGAPDDFTDTNNQVPDVDEADVVETDGTHLYLLHGTDFLVLDSWPPEATALRARLAVEGDPAGMLVDGSRALVVSSVFDDGALGGGCPSVSFSSPVLPIDSSDPIPTASPPRCFTQFTKVTLIDLAGDAPRVVREIYLEGSYTSARRHGNLARVIVQRFSARPPVIPPTSTVWSPISRTRDEHRARVDAWETSALAALEDTDVAEWLPTRVERRNGAIVRGEAACDDVHVPPPAASEDGTVHVVTLDMTVDDGPVAETVVFGHSAIVYSNLDTLVLEQPDWRARPFLLPEQAGGTDTTTLHVFSVSRDSLETTYVASGVVPGIPISQFALDVSGSVLRIATTVTPVVAHPDEPIPSSRITFLRVEGDALVEIGRTPDLAPREEIFAVRFVGTRAYVVTFRLIDPLFVIDVADPANPVILGEVELPGFSEYIHPIGDGRLLTIGRDTDDFGFPRGVALRTFDVSDPTTPRVTDVEVLPGDGWSPAATNHLAFTFDSSRGLLALPYSRFDGDELDAPWRSSLVLLSVDPAGDISVRGEIDHPRESIGPCTDFAPCSTETHVQRGLFIEDWVYSISTAGVLVNAVEDLSQVAEVVLATSDSAPPHDTPAP